jgi:uncharacterized repeat protein (TIGR01451 family)
MLPANNTTALLPAMTAPDSATQQRIRNTFGKLPLHFEANTGQSDAYVKFLSRTGGYTLFLTPTEAVLSVVVRPNAETATYSTSSSRRAPESRMSSNSLDSGLRQNDELSETGPVEDKETKNEASVLRLRWLNANPNPKITGAEPQLGKSTYFHGNDSAKWRSNVTHYGKVHYKTVYPGIDLVYYGNQSKIEFDFVVAPGADPGQIRLAIDGARNIRLDSDGNLILATANGNLFQQAPVIYQEIEGKRVPIEGQYVLHENNDVSFQVAAYDPDQALVIDPILQSTYLGGSGDDQTYALAIHPVSGDVYVGGYTTSTDFPAVAGGPDTAYGAPSEAFIARLNASLTTLIQATYLGGSSTEKVTAIAVHPGTGDVYVAGDTSSLDFPGTAGGAGPTANGTGAFVARLNAGLTTLTQAAHLTGSLPDYAYAIAIHPVSGDVYVAGETQSSDFPGIAGGADTTFTGAYEAFVARLNSALTSLTQATFLGGINEDRINAIAIHPASGDVYVAGQTGSGDFPGVAGGADTTFGGTYEVFVARLNSALTSLTQATFLGGSDNDFLTALAIHPVSGDIYVAGFTSSVDFPGIAGGADTTFGGSQEAFVARLNSALTSLTQATYLGGSANDTGRALVIHPVSGDVYIAGNTDSSDFPGIASGADTTFGGTQEGFVARLNSALTSLTQATFLGGTDVDIAYALTVHPVSGEVYVAGASASNDFPGVTGGAQPAYAGTQDAFVTRLTAELAFLVPVTSDLWDISQGATVTTSSGMHGASSITNMFGGSGGVEPLNTIFRDDQAAGFTHFVEWSAASPIALTGYRLFTYDDGAANVGDRGFTSFRLYGRTSPTAPYQLLDQYIPSSNPSPTPSVTIGVERLITSFTGQDFRAEFVQYANNSFPGVRVVELDAIATAAPVAADIALTTSVSANPVGVSGTLSYTAQVTNFGPWNATGVTLTNTLTGGSFSFGTITPSQGTCTGTTTAVCNLGSLANGASASVVITLTTTAVGAMVFSASATATEADPNAANNTAAVNVPVVQTICSNSLQKYAALVVGAQAAGCSVSVGPNVAAGGGGGSLDPFLLAVLALLFIGQVLRRARNVPVNVGSTSE